MRYITVLPDQAGYALNAEPYIEVLPTILEHLPEGAADFIRDPAHFDYSNVRCVKDLRLRSSVLHGPAARLVLDLEFAPNRFKHDERLVITYDDVASIAFEVGDEGREDVDRELRRHIGDVLLDEVLPHERGCSHEIVLTGGSIRVVSADLRANWLAG